MRKLLGLCIVALSLSGCSAINSGIYQTLTVTTEPENAVCVVKRRGDGAILSSVVSGDTIYNIRRGTKTLDVVCSKEGFLDTQVELRSTLGTDPVQRIAILSTGFFDSLIGTHGSYPTELHVVLRR